MPKHINISINGPIGEFEDDYGWICYGFTAAMVDWMVGYNYEDCTIGYSDLEKVTFHINSDGGSVTEGFEIMSKMEMLKEKGILVEVINSSRAYSIASFLLQGASKGLRKSRSYALFMCHKPWSCVSGNADEMRKYADYLDKYEQPMAKVYVAASGKTEQEITDLLREERFMTADETLAEGFIDEILPMQVAGAAPAQVEKKAVAHYKPKSNQVQPINMAITAKEEESLIDKLAARFGLKAKAAAPNKPASKAANKPTPKPKAEVETPVAATSETADGATIYHEGELEQGTAVFADAEMTEALEDGLYDLNDGREIEVVDGAVANITEAEEEEEGTEASASAKKPTPKAKAGNDDIKALAATVKSLQSTVAKLVPGSGNGTQKPAQSFKEDKEKVSSSNPFDVAAGNAKRKRN